MPLLRGKLKKVDAAKITKNYTYLLSELNGDFLANALLEKGVFDYEDKEEIWSQTTREKKAECFLWRLLDSGPHRAYDVFLEVLRKNYPHVAEKLERTPQEGGASNAEGATNLEPVTSRTSDDDNNI